MANPQSPSPSAPAVRFDVGGSNCSGVFLAVATGLPRWIGPRRTWRDARPQTARSSFALRYVFTTGSRALTAPYTKTTNLRSLPTILTQGGKVASAGK